MQPASRRSFPVLLAIVAATVGCLSRSAASDAPANTPSPAPPAGVTSAPAQAESGSPPERSERAAALIERVSAENLSADVELLAAIPTRHVNSPTVAEAAVAIHDGFQSAGGRLRVEYDPFPLAYNGLQTTQRNIVATLPGSDPSAGIVVVGAHYDSRTVDLTDAASPAPGADDNATGVAALLEMARLLAEMTPRATIVFVAFSAEEVGVVGSTHYVEAALERGDDIRAMFALDIVGNAAGEAGEGAIRAFSAPPGDSSSRQLARYVDLQAQAYFSGFEVQVQPTLDRPGRYSDHKPFSDAGIPAMRLIEPVEDLNSQHSGGDLPGAISPAYLRNATQLALANVVSLADGPPAPGQPALGPTNTLTWMPVEGAAGYVVAFRLDDALEVDTLVRVGDVTSLTWDQMGAGRFGGISVAAVDAEGLMGALSPELALP